MPADDAVAHGQAQARSAGTLRGEEWLETFPQGFFAHPDAGIGNLESNVATFSSRPKTKAPALRHSVDRVKNQIREHFAQLSRHAGNDRNVTEILLDPNSRAGGIRLRFPAWHRKGKRFLDQFVQVHRLPNFSRVGRPVKLAQTLD